jgi:S-adenosylmethionine:tRNA ribosyltransferase-isomerase
MVAHPAFRFQLPDALAAGEPPEKRGSARDDVRLLTLGRATGAWHHGRFRDLAGHLRAGDCLVFNASRTLPASLQARARSGEGGVSEEHGVPGEKGPAGPSLEIRLAQRLGGADFLALALGPAEEPWPGDLRGFRLDLGLGLEADILERDPRLPRLWKIRMGKSGSELMDLLCRLGQPVRYWYSFHPWSLDYYQTVFAREPGSMEMPSAGRAFTWESLLGLRRRGIGIAFLVLHAGLSSYMDREYDATHPASEEPYRIQPRAAEQINRAKAAGGRIIAVGTTVVRALESAADGEGRVAAREGNTRLRITREHCLRSVDGLLTGFHEPEASHLDLLTAFLPEDRLLAAYAEAIRQGYLWHEFGDLNLIL